MKLILPSDTEIEKILQNDLSVITEFYLKNLEYLKKYVNCFCRRIRDFSEREDILQEIFLNFKTLSFENERYFGQSVYWVFYNYHYGSPKKRSQLSQSKLQREEYILDSLVKGLEKEGTTLIEIIPDDTDIFDLAFPREDISQSLFNFLSKNLAKEQKRVFEQFYWTGSTYNEVAETLKKNPRTVKRTREEIFKKFRNRKEELRKFLVEKDYQCQFI